MIVSQLSISGSKMITADPIVPQRIAMIAQNVKYPKLYLPAQTRKEGALG